jgi:hypothetical protein
LQCLFGFAEHDHRRTATAGSDAKAGGEADRFSRYLERRGKNISANPFGEHDGVNCAAARQNEEELVHSRAAEQVIAAQKAGEAAGNLAE